jgi:predicted house-cleaning noncanonical NTP pyrophosphatase (MazG superfamily)
MKIYNKLVRDKIPEIIKQGGSTPAVRVLDEREYILELERKLSEEVSEYLESGSLEELADVSEVLAAILRARGHTAEELIVTMDKKREERGGFAERIYLEYVKSADEDDR